jgi:hypothetical protein
MKIHKLLTALTVVNLLLLAYLASNLQSVGAQGVAPVVRAQALEIVDRQGRVRATLDIQPASKHDGSDTTYPLIEASDAESYVRLTTTDGRKQIIKP